MKAQFATIEAIASLAVAAVAISGISAAIASSNNNAYSSMAAMRLGFAEHDFMAQAFADAPLRSCVDAFVQSGAGCISEYMSRYSLIYGLQNFTTSRYPRPGDNCFPAPYNGILCFSD